MPSWTPTGGDNDVLALDVTSKQMEGVMKAFAIRMDSITKPLTRLATAGSGGGSSGISGLSN